MATTVINRAMFPLSSGISNIMGMKERYDTLQTQLSSGLKATRLSEMGSDRYFDLALRQRISRIDSFGDSIKSVNLRLNVLDQTVSRLDVVESDMRAVTLSGSGGQSSLNFDTAPALAAARLDEVMTLLNVDVAGRYLFGGDKTENRPVEDGLTILNGDGNRMGFINYVASARQRRRQRQYGPAGDHPADDQLRAAHRGWWRGARVWHEGLCHHRQQPLCGHCSDRPYGNSAKHLRGLQRRPWRR